MLPLKKCDPYDVNTSFIGLLFCLRKIMFSANDIKIFAIKCINNACSSVSALNFCICAESNFKCFQV